MMTRCSADQSDDSSIIVRYALQLLVKWIHMNFKHFYMTSPDLHPPFDLKRLWCFTYTQIYLIHVCIQRRAS